ncbi:MAG: phosphoadenosine phosphosulfate reductase family protein, partial [Thermoplasmatota archaeon]
MLVLGEGCDLCGRLPRQFKVSFPGDLRPCPPRGMRDLGALLERHFGKGDLLDGRPVFLNRIAGEDRTEEVVLEGRTIGVIRFDPRSNGLRMDLWKEGARLLSDAPRGVVDIKPTSRFVKGRNLGGDWILEMWGDFREGDPLVLRMGEEICAGVARASSDRAREAERAIGVRDVAKGPDDLPARDLSRKDLVRANRSHLENIESRAVSDIRSFMGNHKGREVTVSFSGGKDSLAAYGVTSEAVGEVPLLFANTGVEFPETVDFVHRFAEGRGIRLMEASAGEAFHRRLRELGPPAKDYRWCCKVCKLSPLSSLINERFPRGVITVEGNRTYESFYRSEIGFVERNPYVPGQTNLNPIRDWTAAEVWAYIWWKGMPYNPLYDEDFQRVGCYLCPSQLASEARVTAELHPELYRDWEAFLLRWFGERGADERYVRHGLWRWRRHPPKMVNLAREMGIPLPRVKGPGEQEEVLSR